MPTINVSNEEFINAVFGVDAPWCHVTDFPYSPDAIPSDKHLFAWKGDYFSRYHMTPNTNQYFTISTFYADEQGTARRRKALYRQTHCIVLDDVKEKLSMDEVEKLPRPTWILESSAGSEQWGYLLDTPCTDRHRAENLLDGLVANGLAPDGRDPGMKGVTRYLRLPEGINNKTSKLVNGQPYDCHMTLWEPFNTVTMEQLAEPFHVNLDALRREARVDGASDISDHPLINDAGDIIHIKEVRSDGRFDITCPWVDEHTGQDDSGSAIFTNDDGTIGFKCHHGACQERNGGHLLRHIESTNPGFGEKFNMWKVVRSFSDFSIPVVDTQVDTQDAAGSDTGHDVTRASECQSDPIGVVPAPQPPVPTQPTVATEDPFKLALSQIRMQEPGTAQQREMASLFLKLVDDSDDKIRAKQLHDDIRDVMNWSKADLKEIITNLREVWYADGASGDVDFFNDVVFVMEQNQFYDRKRKLFYTPEAYANAYADKDPDARKNALQNGMVTKVHRLDYAPKMPSIFVENEIEYSNLWVDRGQPAHRPGDCSTWLNHFDVIGFGGEPMKRILQWMAFTLRHPDIKINHILLIGGHQGIGKDWLMYPLVKAMGVDHKTISGIELLSNFNGYLLGRKHLHLNETELGDHRDAATVANKLKPLATAPPETLSVNQKNVKEVDVRNIVNVSMTTNSQAPFKSQEPSRRFYALWSEYDPRDHLCNVRPEWTAFWVDAWKWMTDGGAEMCIDHLLHHVDLSDFNPGIAPAVTDFMRDIVEASKSPLQQTIEDFITAGVGAFANDVVSANDMCAVLKMGDMPDTMHLMHVDAKRCTPTTVGRVLNDCRGVVKKRGRTGDHSARLYVIRNHERYNAMGPADIMREYERQKKSTAGKVSIKVVS